MNRSSLAAPVAALCISLGGATLAWGDELRGSLDNIDTAHNTISIGGETIKMGQYPLNGLDQESSYVVHFQRQGKENVLTDISADTSGGSKHK